MNEDLKALLLWVTNTKKDWQADYAKCDKSRLSDSDRACLRDEMNGAENAFDEVNKKIKTMLATSRSNRKFYEIRD